MKTSASTLGLNLFVENRDGLFGGENNEFNALILHYYLQFFVWFHQPGRTGTYDNDFRLHFDKGLYVRGCKFMS